MTADQVREAIKQCEVHCKMLEEQNDYTSVSLRGTLYTLGYNAEDADEVVNYCAINGFKYCVDPWIPHTKHNSETGETKYEYPPEFACYWSPDQLRSRLGCV